MTAPRMVAGVGTHSHADRGDDFYATPRCAVDSLLAIEGKWLPRGTVWEPACGDGAIVLPLREAGHNVLASDLIDRGCPESNIRDFLSDGWRPMPAAIITNPPFKLARQFVDTALTHAPYVAMLLRLAFLEGGARMPWFQGGSLARVHVSSRRLPMMHRDGWEGPKAGSAVCHAWFVWDERHEGRPEIQWFDWKDHVRPEAANDNAEQANAA
jgi:hypothetical protein